jgi:hypothetical protein
MKCLNFKQQPTIEEMYNCDFVNFLRQKHKKLGDKITNKSMKNITSPKNSLVQIPLNNISQEFRSNNVTLSLN